MKTPKQIRSNEAKEGSDVCCVGLVGRLFLILACLIILSPAFAAEIQIIANPSVGVSSLSAEDLKGVFLATKTSLKNGRHVEPVLEKEGPVHEAFVKEYLGKTDASLQAYYRSLVFTGRASMPRSLNRDSEVVAYVAKTKGAVGYIAAGCKTNGVKVLQVE